MAWDLFDPKVISNNIEGTFLNTYVPREEDVVANHGTIVNQLLSGLVYGFFNQQIYAIALPYAARSEDTTTMTQDIPAYGSIGSASFQPNLPTATDLFGMSDDFYQRLFEYNPDLSQKYGGQWSNMIIAIRDKYHLYDGLTPIDNLIVRHNTSEIPFWGGVWYNIISSKRYTWTSGDGIYYDRSMIPSGATPNIDIDWSLGFIDTSSEGIQSQEYAATIGLWFLENYSEFNYFPTDWDVYIEGKKNPSITLRWNNDQVGDASDPNFMYHSDDTSIKIYVDDGHNLHELATTLYGELEYKFTYQQGAALANVLTLAQIAGSIFQNTTFGDYKIYFLIERQDGAKSTLCYSQIPYNISPDTQPSDIDAGTASSASDGSTVTVHLQAPTSGSSAAGWNTPAKEPQDPQTPTNPPGSGFPQIDVGTNTNLGLLTKTYCCTESQLQSLGTELWSTDFWENIQMVCNDPIQNIISVKAFPFSIQGGNASAIQLGNVLMNSVAHPVDPSYNPVKTIGTISIPTYYTGTGYDFLDYAPYTSVSIYLPYCGFQSLDLNKVMGKTLTVKYIYDLICGTCTACIYEAGIEIAKYSGQIAIDIPIMASNRAQVEMSYVTGGINTVSNLIGAGAAAATGNIVGAAAGIGGAVSSGLNAAMTPYHTSSSGSPSPSCDAFDNQSCYIIIDRPVFQESAKYAHEHGRPFNLSKRIGEVHGFTQCNNMHLDGIPCTESERSMISALFKEGVYV